MEYDWPVGWIKAYGWLTGVNGLAACGEAGEGAEQFLVRENCITLLFKFISFYSSHRCYLHTRNCAEVRISPRGSTPAADEAGRGEVDVETSALGHDRGDKPHLKPPLAKQSKVEKRGKRGKKETKSVIIKKNRLEEDEHKTHDRITSQHHRKI